MPNLPDTGYDANYHAKVYVRNNEERIKQHLRDTVDYYKTIDTYMAADGRPVICIILSTHDLPGTSTPERREAIFEGKKNQVKAALEAYKPYPEFRHRASMSLKDMVHFVIVMRSESSEWGAIEIYVPDEYRPVGPSC